MSLKQHFNIRVADSSVSTKLQSAYGHTSNLTMMNEAMTYLSLQASCERQGLALAALDEQDGTLHALEIRAPGECSPVISVNFAVNPEALQKIMQQTGRTEMTGLLEEAIALYDAIHRAKSLGHSIVKASPETGQFKRVAIYTPIVKPAKRDFI